MKFSEKYPSAKPKDVIRADSLLVSDHKEPCSVCGEPTQFIDFCFEARFCSEECAGKETDAWAAMMKRHEHYEPDLVGG